MVVREGLAVGREHALDELLDLLRIRPCARCDFLDRHDERRVADDARLPVHDLGQLGKRLEAVLRLRLDDALLRPLRLFLRGDLVDQLHELVLVETRVPDVEAPHSGEGGHRLTVGTNDLEVDGATLLLVEAAVPARDRKARDEAFDVPLEWAGQGLVEVVEAEYKPAVRCRESAEVGQMRVSAQLRLQARAG